MPAVTTFPPLRRRTLPKTAVLEGTGAFLYAKRVYIEKGNGSGARQNAAFVDYPFLF